MFEEPLHSSYRRGRESLLEAGVGLGEASFIELADPHFTQILHLCH